MMLLIATLLAASVALNAFLLLKHGAKPPKAETYEAQDLLRDLMAGEALVSIKRVAPADVFLRSPRGLG